MEIVYRTGTVQVHKTSKDSFTPLQVVAVGYLDGCTIYFGGFDGRVTCMFEEVTGIRCCDYQSYPASYSVEKCVGLLEKILYEKLQESGLSFHEVRDRWLQTGGKIKTHNFVPLWHTSLLIG